MARGRLRHLQQCTDGVGKAVAGEAEVGEHGELLTLIAFNFHLLLLSLLLLLNRVSD